MSQEEFIIKAYCMIGGQLMIVASNDESKNNIED